MFEYAAHTWGMRSALIRLSYALDLRYGVLHDIGASLRDGLPVNLGMSRASVIWQGDACDLILRTLEHTSAPPLTLNVSGLEPIRIRDAAVQLGRLLGVEPAFAGVESDSALFVDCRRMAGLVGEPMTPLASGAALDGRLAAGRRSHAGQAHALRSPRREVLGVSELIGCGGAAGDGAALVYDLQAAAGCDASSLIGFGGAIHGLGVHDRAEMSLELFE